MLGANHAAPDTDIRICLKIRKHLRVSDGGKLSSQVCIHQMPVTVTRENQILLAVNLRKMLLKFVKLNPNYIAINEERQATKNMNIPVQIRQETPPSPQLIFSSVQLPIPEGMPSESPIVPDSEDFQIRQETPLPPQLLFDDQIIQLGKRKDTHDGSADLDPDQTNPEDSVATDEQWEDELDECLVPNLTDIRGWDLLREQIKNDLEKKYKSLPLSQINQYMILRNFATLRLKGLRRIEASKEIALQWHQKLEGSSEHFARRIRALARHYQIFEHLPKEKRGGLKNSRSVMKNETVLRASRAWLIQQKKGSVSPGKFQRGINEVILPSLNIFPSKPLCE